MSDNRNSQNQLFYVELFIINSVDTQKTCKVKIELKDNKKVTIITEKVAAPIELVLSIFRIGWTLKPP